jgi:hypothetical protein
MSSIRLYQFFSIVLCLTANAVFAQELTFLDSIPIDGSKIVVDKMGYMYAVESDRIIKYSPQGDSMFYYCNKLLGEIDQLEVSLALRPLIFYKNSNQIIITDNTLSAQINQTIPLEQLDWQQVTRIASSFNDNKVWLFDQSNFELLLVSRQLNIEQRSGNLLQIINLDSIEAKQIKEYQNKIFLNNPKNGIHIFDLFGTYYNTIHLTGLDDFELYNNYIVSFRNDSICFYNTIAFTETTIPTPLSDFVSITLKNELLYILRSGMVYRYKIAESR